MLIGSASACDCMLGCTQVGLQHRLHYLRLASNPGFSFWILSHSFFFLQSCGIKSGTESLGSRLTLDGTCQDLQQVWLLAVSVSYFKFGLYKQDKADCLNSGCSKLLRVRGCAQMLYTCAKLCTLQTMRVAALLI